MRARFVSELAEGSRVDDAYVLRSKEMRAARNGDAYLALVISDKTGCIPAVYFRPSPGATSVPTGSVVRVEGTVTTYRGVKRVSVDTMLPAAKWDSGDFLASGLRPTDELVAEMTGLIRTIANKDLRSLLRGVFGDKIFFDRFRSCPASEERSRAFLGGLIEHTIAVAGLCIEMARRYETIDGDALLAMALLHDIGQVDALSYDTTISVTDQGRLLGHVILGLRRVDDAARRLRIDPAITMRIEHAIASHHEDEGGGAYAQPCTVEALVLRRADELDKEAEGFSHALTGASVAQESWTGSTNSFGRALYAVPSSRSPEGIADVRAPRKTA